MTPPTPELSGVVVHWGDPAPLLELVRAWPTGDRFELVVVDNGGPGNGGATTAGGPWEEIGRRAHVLRPGGNLGFAGGANAGADAARGEILLVLNPDARPEAGALEALLAGFRDHPDAAGLAPRLLGPGGEPQARWQLRSVPALGHLLLQALQLPAAPEAAAEPAAGATVEQPAAAALALRRSAFRAVGGFDPRFHPAWFEDVDLALRLRAAGHTVRYHPDSVFRHALGHTVGQLGYGRFLWTYQRNLVRYLGKHHGRAAAAVARALLPVGHLLRAALLPLRRPRRARGRLPALAGLAGALAGAVTGWRRPRRWAAADPSASRSPGTTAPAPPTAPGRLRPPGRASTGGPAEPPPPPDAGDPPAVAVCVVTHGGADDVEPCFRAVAALEHRPLEVVVADCASPDDTVPAVERHRALLTAAGVPLTLLPLPDNRGFAGGMNAALAATQAPWVLALNADARPEPDYVTRLLERAAAHPELAVGAVTGRLLRPAEADGQRRLDACGMRLTRTWRHLDRGSGEPERGQHARPARVFGATGAASLFRRAALDDAAVDGEAFDPRFHSFREDAELAFRLRERGWEVLYEPAARAEHRRFNLPGRRRSMPPQVNLHSLKNRYLLRLYHGTARTLLPTLPQALARDLAALGYVLLRERSSLPAYAWLWRHRREAWRRRRRIQARRRVGAGELAVWFRHAELPLPGGEGVAP